MRACFIPVSPVIGAGMGKRGNISAIYLVYSCIERYRVYLVYSYTQYTQYTIVNLVGVSYITIHSPVSVNNFKMVRYNVEVSNGIVQITWNPDDQHLHYYLKLAERRWTYSEVCDATKSHL